MLLKSKHELYINDAKTKLNAKLINKGEKNIKVVLDLENVVSKFNVIKETKNCSVIMADKNNETQGEMYNYYHNLHLSKTFMIIKFILMSTNVIFSAKFI